MPGTLAQQIVLSVWAIAAVYLINRGGRNNGIFMIVVSSGFRLILLGCIAAALLATYGDSFQSTFTTGAVNFVLVISAAVGANYISHANMSLRDFPNKNIKREKMPPLVFRKKNRKGVSSKRKDD